MPVSGPIQVKVKAFADALGIESFRASNGWLQSFMKRNNIGFNVLFGEGRDVDESVVSDWKKNLQEVCDGYPPEDLFNLDEGHLLESSAKEVPYNERRSMSRGQTI